MELDRAAGISMAEQGSGFVWLGIVEPEPEELELVRRRFGLHDLAVERRYEV